MSHATRAGGRSRARLAWLTLPSVFSRAGYGNGYWRGANASLEVVMCAGAFEAQSHWPLEALCAHGYSVAAGDEAAYWASDLLHRLLHVPSVNDGGVVRHFASEYVASVALARASPGLAVRNIDSLLYFALDVYAFDVAVPGVGCTGVLPPSNATTA